MSRFNWWRAAGLVAVALMVATMAFGLGGRLAAGQTQPQSTPEAEITPTPVVGTTSGPGAQPTTQQTQQTQQSSQQTSGPVAASSSTDTAPPVLAQGLVFLTGADVVWQVREVELTEAVGASGNARVVLGREGSTIIRNDVTAKRALIEPGEAYFAAAEDPYTMVPEDGTATVWIFEIANNNNVGEGAFYLSPNVQGYAEGVYDFEFTRDVLTSGETSEFEGGVGPSMLMVLSGNVDVTSDNGTASLEARDGLVVPTSASIEATSSEAVYITMKVGPEVGDTTAAPAQASQTDTDTQEADATEETTGEATEETEEAAPSAAPAEPSGAAGAYVTSIQVGALGSIGVTLYVDGEVAFDGWLEAGQWTDFYTGSTFEVYTTSGANTQFLNSCGGDPFFMGYEEGDAYYYLEASAESCAPVE